jgi:hypothetical protein
MSALLMTVLVIAGLAAFDLLAAAAGADSRWRTDDDHQPPPWL